MDTELINGLATDNPVTDNMSFTNDDASAQGATALEVDNPGSDLETDITTVKDKAEVKQMDNIKITSLDEDCPTLYSYSSQESIELFNAEGREDEAISVAEALKSDPPNASDRRVCMGYAGIDTRRNELEAFFAEARNFSRAKDKLLWLKPIVERNLQSPVDHGQCPISGGEQYIFSTRNNTRYFPAEPGFRVKGRERIEAL